MPGSSLLCPCGAMATVRITTTEPRTGGPQVFTYERCNACADKNETCLAKQASGLEYAREPLAPAVQEAA